MTGSHSRKDKPGSRYPVSKDDLKEGTSARTRPLSYDEIMLRRINKKDATKQVPSNSEVAGIALGHDNTGRTSDFPAHHRQINEDAGPTDVRNISNDSQKVNLRRKGEITAPKKNEKLVPDKDGVSRYHGVKLKSIWDKTENRKREREGDKERLNHIDRKKDVPPLDVGLDNESNQRQAIDSSYRKDRTSERGRVKSEIDRNPIFNGEKQVHRIRKTEWRMSSDYEKNYTRRNERITNRGREKSEKEIKQRFHNEDDKTKNRGTDKNDDSERKGPEPTRVSLEDSRAKRRRSRSREHEKDRGRRSRSHSPKLNKHTLKDKREHEDKSSHSTKDRSGREHSEADKNRLSTNGSSIPNRDNSERKGPEPTQVSLEESRAKRRRSRSREHEKDRGRRSRSRSPKLNKHTSKDKREHEDKSSHSTKDRSGREHSEADKNRLSTNESSIHNRDDSGRKGPETTRVSLEESRAKRRRSRSREHEKDRGRRSRSRSPNPNKHTLKDKREHEDKSSHSTKDRPGREHSEADKNRLSTNGSSIHNRRSTGTLSGLGGYSPRKRKTAAAAKTPSPTLRSPERRNAQWDLQHVEKESIMASSARNNLPVPIPNIALNIKEFTSLTPVLPTLANPILISRQIISSQMHAIGSVQLTQATRPMRRLYVENLPPSASEKDLIECINKSLWYGVNYIQRSQPCISCIIHKERSQALLEFLTPEDASSALSLDGMSFAGSNLKFRRPKDFTSVTTGISDKSVADVDSIRDIVEDSPHKIFIGGIPKLISSNMFLEIAKTFGPLKAFHFECVSDVNEPHAFLEYVDHTITSKACAGLNGMKLGGRVVTAVFATPEAVLENVGKLPFYGIPEHAKPLLEEPTSVLKLMNVLDSEGLLSLSESEVEDILEDIKLECSRFGTVKSINVARPTISVSIIEACEVKNTNAFSDAHSIEFVNRSYSKEPLGDSINGVGELDTSEPTQSPNWLENIIPSLEDTNDSDNTVEMCQPPSRGENMSIKEFEKPGGFIEDFTNEQKASVTELESNDNTGSKPPIKGDLQFEEHNAKIGSSGEEMKLEEINAPEEGCDEKDVPVNLDEKNFIGSLEDTDGPESPDNTVEMCKPPSRDENMSIKESRKPGGFIEDITKEQNASVTEPESNDDTGSKSSIERDLQFEVDKSKTGSSGEEINAPEEGCNAMCIPVNLENADMENKPLVMGDFLSEAKVESSGEEFKPEENILPEECAKNDIIISDDLENVFEAGSVFVEYRRPEAASVAAHCLHGRMFDGRVVTVGYVSHDRYHARFCK